VRRARRAHDFLVDEDALILRSAALYEADDWGQEALEANRELVERFPDAAGPRYRLAVCFEEAGDLLAARATYARFLERRADGLEARVALRRLAILDERARAIRTPSVYEALARGRKLARQGDLECAMVWYERAQETAKTANERAQALTGQASVLRTERRFGEALSVAERAVAAQPSRAKNMPAYASRIGALVDLGRLETAREEAEKLLAAHPRDPIVAATASRAYRELHRRTGNEEYKAKAGRYFGLSHRKR
jgi:tetratricopeptide (TPR) repeat protein